MMRTVAKAILTVMGISLLMAGCNTSGCLENRNSVPKAGFYSSSNSSSIVLDSVQITGMGMSDDDPLYKAGTKISTVSLPMRSTMQSTEWVFSYKWKYLDNPALNDTIQFTYESTPYFASSECGVIYKYLVTDVKYTTHLMDSVVMADSLITNLDIEQIRIYFRTSDEETE